MAITTEPLPPPVVARRLVFAGRVKSNWVPATLAAERLP